VRASRPYISHLAFAVVATVVVLRPLAATAQPTPCANQALPTANPWNPAAPFRLLVQLDLQDCLGGTADTAQISMAVRKVLTSQPDDKDLLRPAVANALALVDEELGKIITPESHNVLREVRQQVEVVRATLGSGKTPALSVAWQVNTGGRLAIVSISLQTVVDGACTTRDAACTRAFDDVKEVLRFAHLTSFSLERSESPIMEGIRAENNKRLKSWDEYFSRGRSQYIWELALNGFRLSDTRQEITPGVKGGFREVPRDQIMFLHPNVALEYAQAEAEGNKFNGTVLVDLVGYNRWRWKPDGSMGFALGGSLLMAASDHAITDDVALGFMVHVNNRWSLGMVFGGEDPTWVVSADVAQLWTKVSEVTKGKLMTGK
jgi:hypothetical protein